MRSGTDQYPVPSIETVLLKLLHLLEETWYVQYTSCANQIYRRGRQYTSCLELPSVRHAVIKNGRWEALRGKDVDIMRLPIDLYCMTCMDASVTAPYPTKL